jgi:hypothetical protein
MVGHDSIKEENGKEAEFNLFWQETYSKNCVFLTW